MLLIFFTWQWWNFPQVCNVVWVCLLQQPAAAASHQLHLRLDLPTAENYLLYFCSAVSRPNQSCVALCCTSASSVSLTTVVLGLSKVIKTFFMNIIAYWQCSVSLIGVSLLNISFGCVFISKSRNHFYEHYCVLAMFCILDWSIFVKHIIWICLDL